MRFISLAVAVLLGSLLSAQCATATTITQSIDFTASDFTSDNTAAFEAL